ncbi:DUF2059 domain-containing protein [Pelagibacterium sp.]|uniref:DUF2059 domain-containing protein n=1 Tax=Pelagibacterium sp. TaxID=1967288 RepID=UPI003A8F070B
MTFLPTLRRLAAALVLSGAALLATAPANAQQEISPEHLAKAREYVDMTDSAQLYERTLVEMGLRVMRLMIQEDPSLRDPLINALQTVYDSYLEDRGSLYDQFARIYAVRFSLEELEEIVGFYSTPVGEKLLGENAGINEDLQLALGVWSRNTGNEFLSRVRQELRNQGYNAPAVEAPAAEDEEAAPQ